MAPGQQFVVNDLGATELQELENEDIDEPDSVSVLNPDKNRYVWIKATLELN